MLQAKVSPILLVTILCVLLQQLSSVDLAPTRKVKALSAKDRKAVQALYHRSMLEGDILVRNKTSSVKKKVAPLDNKFRNAVHLDEQVWPNGVIPYYIEDGAQSKKTLVQNAMSQIMRHTCVRFREKTSADQYYVRIFSGIGCYASIGRDVDFPEGLVSLGDGCDYIGTVVHELMHVIGYYHEHNRNDRDEYLQINFANINPDDVDQFNINQRNEERILTAFDYNSVMLYGPRAFSKDPNNLITMEPKLAGFYMIEVHEKPGLTKLDAESIKKLYKCPA